MKRRQFSVSLLGLAAAGAALGQGGTPAAAPVEGTNYVRLTPPAPVSAPSGKFDVIEFFWYGCPHCYAFEPAVEAWLKRAPADVAFRRVPVALYGDNTVVQQRLYYALEALDLLPSLHRKVFYAIHNDRMRLDKLPDITAFMAKNGVDAAKFGDAFNSFAVQTKTRQATVLSDAYKIDGVPAIGVHGRYYTSGSLTGSNEKMLAVADFLLARIRKGT
jgi:thiol:disulfide interchange protein DsbA